MQLLKIDLSSIVAIGHEDGKLALLVDRGDAMEYLEVNAPQAAYSGLQAVSAIAEEDLNLFPLDIDGDDTTISKTVTVNYLMG
ncbi:MAG: hypothetical protein J7641_19670 [Cyanobacteria bacterium SID2]|nr:hypothetical protein [Cyanobacteria bacterium SID2]MBP0004245.1 hypothetical protein [Cyanobacteria bacterium SBC]